MCNSFLKRERVRPCVFVVLIRLDWQIILYFIKAELKDNGRNNESKQIYHLFF